MTDDDRTFWATVRTEWPQAAASRQRRDASVCRIREIERLEPHTEQRAALIREHNEAMIREHLQRQELARRQRRAARVEWAREALVDLAVVAAFYVALGLVYLAAKWVVS